jgi:hypothetical protein
MLGQKQARQLCCQLIKITNLQQIPLLIRRAVLTGINPVSYDKAAGAGIASTCCLSTQPASTGGFFGDC